jgi:DNA excision repair protein ERCC-4
MLDAEERRALLVLRIVVDTREQMAFPLTGFDIVRKKLNAGDYSLEGYEDRVAVERKNPADAWACVGSGRARFVDCLERLAGLDRAAIVIECSLSEFAVKPPYVKRITPATAVGSYISWSCRYRIPVFWCDNRQYAERVAVRFLAAYLKHVVKANAALKVGGTT